MREACRLGPRDRRNDAIRQPTVIIAEEQTELLGPVSGVAPEQPAPERSAQVSDEDRITAEREEDPMRQVSRSHLLSVDKDILPPPVWNSMKLPVDVPKLYRKSLWAELCRLRLCKETQGRPLKLGLMPRIAVGQWLEVLSPPPAPLEVILHERYSAEAVLLRVSFGAHDQSENSSAELGSASSIATKRSDEGSGIS